VDCFVHFRENSSFLFNLATYLCAVKKEEVIVAFHHLGNLMRIHGSKLPWPGFSCGVTEDEFLAVELVIERQVHHNGWFTEASVRNALLNLGNWLTEEQLTAWASKYEFTGNPKVVAVIMAGNIPLVGFHDFLCVLLSGNKVQCKQSSEDNKLLPLLVNNLLQFAPELKACISFSDRNLSGFDAVIATGSNNSLVNFESYFSKYPHLFRHNRTSIAVLDGTETKAELKALGEDILNYFGRGCRNVTHLLIPKDFDLNRFFESIVDLGEVINNKKYGNNYDYNKTIHLLNLESFLDNNFLLLKESEQLFSPLAMLHYHTYSTQEEIKSYLETHKDALQCVVGHDYLPLGTAQCPSLSDYADNVDTMMWLNGL
jgi:hypothetical protein